MEFEQHEMDLLVKALDTLFKHRPDRIMVKDDRTGEFGPESDIQDLILRLKHHQEMFMSPQWVGIH